MSNPIDNPAAINPKPSPEPLLKKYKRATVQWYEGHFAEKSRVEPPIGDPGPWPNHHPAHHPHKQEGS
jgi:hypothetical protein